MNCIGIIVTRNRLIGLRCRGLIASIGLSVVDGVRGLDRWDMFLLILKRPRLLLRRRVLEDETSRFKGMDRYCSMEFGFCSMILVYSILDI